MKVNKQLAALAVALSAVSGAAVAADGGSGFYIGGGLGGSNHEVNCSGDISCSNPSIAYKLFGGYQFSPNFALEGGFVDFGKINVDNNDLHNSIRSYSFTVAGLGIIPLNDQAKIFGKLGAHYTNAKVEFSYPGHAESNTYGKGGVLFGLGFQYDFTKNFSARVEHEWLNLDSDALTSGSLRLYTANLIYKF